MQKRGGEKRGNERIEANRFMKNLRGKKSNPQITKLSETLEEIGGKPLNNKYQL